MLLQRNLKASFIVSSSNYLSTLYQMNIVEIIDTINGLWEGIHTNYIQELKRELSTLRHTIKFLVTFLLSVWGEPQGRDTYDCIDSLAAA